MLTENKVQGEHSIDDVQETINSLKLFDFVINTLSEELTPRLLKEFNSLLKQNTKQDEYELIGVYKKIPNKLLGVNIETTQPFEVEEKINNLLKIEIKNVEDIEEFDKRVKEAINFIIRDSEGLNSIAIVTYGGVHRSIFKNILNINKKIEGIDDVATTILEYNNGKFKIIETRGIKFGEDIK